MYFTSQDMKLWRTCLLFTFVLFNPVRTAVVGQCPKIDVVENFNAAAFLGKWYEVSKFPVWFELGQKCVTAEYSLKSSGNVKVNNSGVLVGLNLPVSAIGDATIPDADKGRLEVRFSNLSSRVGYNILDTDYNTYTVVFSCSDSSLFNAQCLWVLARDREWGTDANIERVVKVAKDYGIDTSKLQKTNNEGCSSSLKPKFGKKITEKDASPPF